MDIASFLIGRKHLIKIYFLAMFPRERDHADSLCTIVITPGQAIIYIG